MNKRELSQYDLGQVLRNVHEKDNKSLRFTSGNTSVPTHYSRVSLTYNSSNSVTNAIFYEGLNPEVRHIVFKADVAGSLNNKYFPLYSENDESLYHIWYNVNGAGTDPAPANSIGIEILLQTNDSATVVRLATKLSIGALDDFIVEDLEDAKLKITNTRKGVCTNIADVDTGFDFSTIQNGTEIIVKSVDIPFDGSVIYNYNTQEQRFDIFPSEIIAAPSIVTPTITNLVLPTANTEVDHVLQVNLKKIRIKNRDTGKLQFAFIDTNSGTTYITIPPGSEYNETGINLTSGTLSIQSNKNSQTVEILEWA